ncbi:allophanate hydrolase subunit 1 [Paramagnetospirillum caucaseum]|uniref:Allophanate hydrolase subunit 1 n=1 Tax=Paramagnetospirillum caucaseum TaxID=1244869 RepID=M3A8A1_9PROT|nr:5-oxoprolinase subunit PxpB [Paramagnetospirillum caucaseum]EME69033.1 allophanate hydrolase subunit 1 [Paramagnetospirillum caucaseum]
MDTLRIADVGDTAFSVEFGDTIDPATSAKVTGLRHAIQRARRDGGLPGLVETVPTFRSLLIQYDPLVTGRAALEADIRAIARDCGGAPRAAGRSWLIPVCYDEDLGEDLAALGKAGGLSRDEAVGLHTGAEFMVYMLGFMPGFAYMGGVPAPLRRPRRPSPRLKVPAGSVAVAESLCAVYPWESPGGWHLIGQTPVSFFDLSREPPILLEAGDRVRFRAIGRAEFDAARRDPGLMTPHTLLAGEG